jgi:hypothetical protein
MPQACEGEDFNTFCVLSLSFKIISFQKKSIQSSIELKLEHSSVVEHRTINPKIGGSNPGEKMAGKLKQYCVQPFTAKQ